MFRLFYIKSTRVECSYFVLAAVILALIAEQMSVLLVAFFSLTLHEACHSIIAVRLGYRVSSVEIQPFGFVARLQGGLLRASDELAIAAAGPVCSLVAGCAALSIGRLLPVVSEALNPFVAFNLSLAAVNLLPALPLDGGRISKAFLQMATGPRIAVRVCGALGVVFGAAMLAFAVILSCKGMGNITLYIMGLFLVIAALRELKYADSARIDAMMRRKSVLRGGGWLDFKQFAMSKNTSAGEALRVLSMNRYNVIIVVDADMKKLGEIDECRLMSGIARYGVQVPLEKLIGSLP